MLAVIEQNLEQIGDICRRHGVKRLELFGSPARDDFESAKSDLDYFVEFLSDDWHNAADQWFGLQKVLESLMMKKVDLVCIKSVWNPYFLKVANTSRVERYAS